MMANEAKPAAASPIGPQRQDAAPRTRLVPAAIGHPVLGWAAPLLITALGGFLRFDRLSVPGSIVFDETYYVGDAYGILKHGVEINHLKNANAILAGGGTRILGAGGEFVVHPPLGKVAIAGGEWLFGLTPFGWRFTAALVGTLSILMTARIARRMTRSTLLGCVAGLLLALDGLELVMSRTALLDIFVMFWVLAAFGCLVIDRDRTRDRIAAAAAAGPGSEASNAGAGGPALGIRWWRVLAGLCLGLATASKWNGVYFIAGFAALAVAWDLGARRSAGYTSYVRGVLARDVPWLPLSFGVMPVAAYLAAYSGWFASRYGYDRNWAAQHGNHTPVWSALDSLYHYTHDMWHFSVTLAATHPYRSQPWTWLLLSRPVAFYYHSTKGCGASGGCSQEVLAIGTPLIWWAGIPALLICLVWWLSRRDWRAGAVLMGVAAGWLPWFWFAWRDNRTMFYFYSVAFDPFLVIAITLCLGLLIGPAVAAQARRVTGAVLAGVYLLAVLTDFYYMYPVLAARVMPYSSWLARMWYHGWI